MPLCMLEAVDRLCLLCSVCCALFAGVAGGDALRAAPHIGGRECFVLKYFAKCWVVLCPRCMLEAVDGTE